MPQEKSKISSKFQESKYENSRAAKFAAVRPSGNNQFNVNK
jgi:hypothetical protein